MTFPFQTWQVWARLPPTIHPIRCFSSSRRQADGLFSSRLWRNLRRKVVESALDLLPVPWGQTFKAFFRFVNKANKRCSPRSTTTLPNTDLAVAIRAHVRPDSEAIFLLPPTSRCPHRLLHTHIVRRCRAEDVTARGCVGAHPPERSHWCCKVARSRPTPCKITQCRIGPAKSPVSGRGHPSVKQIGSRSRSGTCDPFRFKARSCRPWRSHPFCASAPITLPRMRPSEAPKFDRLCPSRFPFPGLRGGQAVRRRNIQVMQRGRQRSRQGGLAPQVEIHVMGGARHLWGTRGACWLAAVVSLHPISSLEFCTWEGYEEDERTSQRRAEKTGERHRCR